MASFKAINDTLYPAALAGLLLIAFSASHVATPAKAAFNGATPFGADGVENVISQPAAPNAPAASPVIHLKDVMHTVTTDEFSPLTMDFAIDTSELTGQAGSEVLRVLIRRSDARQSL